MHIKTITQILEQINSGTLVNQFADRIYLALLTRVTNPAVCVEPKGLILLRLSTPCSTCVRYLPTGIPR